MAWEVPCCCAVNSFFALLSDRHMRLVVSVFWPMVFPSAVLHEHVADGHETDIEATRKKLR